MPDIDCPKCNTGLRIPDDAGDKRIRCPECKHIFYSSVRVSMEQANDIPPPIVDWRAKIAIACAVLVVGGFLLFLLTRSGDSPGVTQGPSVSSPIRDLTHRPRIATVADDVQARPGRWIAISYRDLVDHRQRGHSASVGELLRLVVSEPDLGGELQPFLDPFGSLLPHALDMLQGAPELPRCNLSGHFPPGSRQPAWAAILRNGRIVVTDDGDSCASAFVPGSDPEVAYKRSYGVLRHALASLLPAGRKPLRISVYAYRNDYASCELSLNIDPLTFEAMDFPAPAGKLPLDLVGLRRFFGEDVRLVGGRIDSRAGLVLVGKEQTGERLAGQKVTLSDLAVAYRAVFHAGDNAAFVSLDPHRDPTLVKVNFGGLLEDTRLGSVVLAADRRFKTINCGLDPDSHEDVRATVRASVAGFASVDERELCTPATGKEDWRGTRFWYYPDSVVVETDLDYRHGVVSRAQFTADAERSREDYKSMEDFERFKKTQLSPSIRFNIDHLNEHYEQYVTAFPELGELSVVARLMGLCVWLRRAESVPVDLDELLTVDLPACQTPREDSQLVAATVATAIRATKLGLAEAQRRAVVAYLTPKLDRPLAEVFDSDEELARILARVDGAGDAESSRYLNRASLMRRSQGAMKLRAIASDIEAFKVLAEVLADRVEAPYPPELAALEARIDEALAGVKQLERRLESLKATMGRSVEDHNRLVDQYNRLVDERRELARRGKADVQRYKEIECGQHIGVGIVGGIGLEPDNFTVQETRQSPALEAVRRVLDEVPGTSGIVNGTRWFRTPPQRARPSSPVTRVGRVWRGKQTRRNKGVEGAAAVSSYGDKYWRVVLGDATGWRDHLGTASGSIVQRFHDTKTGSLELVSFEGGKPKLNVLGRHDGDRRIVFERSLRRDLPAPDSPPHWWPFEE